MQGKHVKKFKDILGQQEKDQMIKNSHESKIVDLMLKTFTELFENVKTFTEDEIVDKIDQYMIWVDATSDEHSRKFNDKIDFIKDAFHFGFEFMDNKYYENMIKKLEAFERIVTNLSNRLKNK